MFLRLGRGVVLHPWRVIIFWAIAAVAIIGFAPKLVATTNEASFLPSHYQSIQAQEIQQQHFPNAAAPAAIIVFERTDGQRLSPADSAKITSIGHALSSKQIPTLGEFSVGSPSPNGLIQTISVQMPNSSGQLSKAQTDAITTLRSDLNPWCQARD
jgi:RND superfamily putative drug exporter